MKIFNREETFSEKVNFADENNVCLGYDMSQSCCEDADWFISEKEENHVYGSDRNHIGLQGLNVESYVFDPKYFVEVEAASDLDAGGMVRFRLVSGKKELFLHIYNNHNGYYGHGFSFKIGEKLKNEGYL